MIEISISTSIIKLTVNMSSNYFIDGKESHNKKTYLCCKKTTAYKCCSNSTDYQEVTSEVVFNRMQDNVAKTALCDNAHVKFQDYGKCVQSQVVMDLVYCFAHAA